ncbi:DUF1622 domain-containing protein [Plantactinospora sp. KBS50]|uniref:DUF1622 domain-containing protein n=1 Tax=Plantactinospora sp. KBS50 TaxID=2024580 RepID=UPI001E582E21|nr:DUF1622 domain-containing protein [Plantactinospora sp. KBS50]
MEGITELLGRAARAFELIGAGVLVLGLVWSAVAAGRAWRNRGGRAGYRTLRQTFGGVLLLGLEVLVAADLIRTVGVSPSLANVAGLGLIVLIRTFLSFSLEIEIEGVAPWRRALVTGPEAMARAARGRPESARPESTRHDPDGHDPDGHDPAPPGAGTGQG